MRYLCWPILRRRASNWNFPKRDSAPSQPLAPARFFALDPRLLNLSFLLSLLLPPLKSDKGDSPHSAGAPPRSDKIYTRASICTYLSISTCRFTPGSFDLFIQQSEVRNIDEESRDKYE